MELIMSGLKRGQVRAFHARPLHIAKLKERLVLINWLKPGNEAALLLLGGQGQGCWGGVSSSKRWGGAGRGRREERGL